MELSIPIIASPTTADIPVRRLTSVIPSWLCFELLNVDVFAVLLAIIVYLYLFVECGGYRGQLTLSSVSLLFGGPAGPIVSQIITAQVADNSLINHLWINVDPAQCLITIAERHNISLRLDPSIPSAPLLNLENLNRSYYGQCSAMCASKVFTSDCVVHYLVPARILDQHLSVLLLNGNTSFAAMSDYYVLFQDSLREYRATSGSGSVDIVHHPVTTVSSAFFGKSSVFQCNNKPCIVFDSYTSVAPRAHIATSGEIALGYSVPWTTNDKLQPTCTTIFAPAESKHRAEIGLASLDAMGSCQTIEVKALDDSMFMTAYPTNYLGDQVLVDASNRRLLVEPSHLKSTLELVTLTTMVEIGWRGWQHSHILCDEDLQLVSKHVDSIVMIQSSILPNIAVIALQLLVYYFITYKFVLRGVQTNPAIYVGLSDVISRSSFNYVFLIQGVAGCVGATGVLAWAGPVYKQLTPWGTSTAEMRPVHALTILSVLQYYITSACGRSIFRRNIARNVIRTRSYTFVQDVAVCAVAIGTVTIGFLMTVRGKYIAPRQPEDEVNTGRIDVGIVVGVNIAPHIMVEIVTRLIAVERKATRPVRPLNTFEMHCVGARIEVVVSVLGLRWVMMEPSEVQSCITVRHQQQRFVRREVVVLLGYVYVPGGIVRVRDVLALIIISWHNGMINVSNQFSVTLWRTRSFESGNYHVHHLEIEDVCHHFCPLNKQVERVVGDIGGTG